MAMSLLLLHAKAWSAVVACRRPEYQRRPPQSHLTRSCPSATAELAGSVEVASPSPGSPARLANGRIWTHLSTVPSGPLTSSRSAASSLSAGPSPLAASSATHSIPNVRRAFGVPHPRPLWALVPAGYHRFRRYARQYVYSAGHDASFAHARKRSFLRSAACVQTS